MRRQRDADKAEDDEDNACAGDVEIFRCRVMNIMVVNRVRIDPWEDDCEDGKVEGSAEGYEEACFR